MLFSLPKAVSLDPEAVTYKFHGWLRAHCGRLAGLTKQATAGYGLGIEPRLKAAYCGLSIPYPVHYI